MKRGPSPAPATPSILGVVRLFDTATASVRPLEVSGDLRLYVCGVTPYDTTHAGHARTYLVFDVLLRHLRRGGHAVRYVQNVTDVDDSIVARARDLRLDAKTLGDRYLAIYFEDLAALGLLPPDAFPRATDHVAEMQDAIATLIERGRAYEVDGDVFFDVGSVDGYGARLARLDRDRMLEIEANQDGSTVDDPRKRDPLDFLLWRAADDEPAWASPWGRGRPGWHIECSTLCTTHLGPRIDIHGGGSDLVFPHHEAEIAQSEALSGETPFSRFWVHVGMVGLHGEKMSKSTGNMVFVRDLLHRFTPDAIRIHLLGTHYRDPFDFTFEDLSAASGIARRLTDVARRHAGGEGRGTAVHDPAEPGVPDGPERAVVDALDDDLDTPRALRALEDVADAVDRGDVPAARLRDLASGRLGLRL